VGAVSIDRCVCEGKSFCDLVALARALDLDLAALAEREGCGTHCGWCVAYLRRALASGDVVFRELLPKEPL
jgi:bacterioferritin-associated ferredoxin